MDLSDSWLFMMYSHGLRKAAVAILGVEAIDPALSLLQTGTRITPSERTNTQWPCMLRT